MTLKVTVNSVTGERFTQIVESGKHQLISDKSESFGGSDKGPGPYSYLLAALGSWTAITLRMYAERKGFKLNNITIRLSHDRRDLEDCSDRETTEDKVDQIQSDIHLDGELDESQRKRLLEIATRCWMHRTLSPGVKIRTNAMNLSQK